LEGETEVGVRGDLRLGVDTLLVLDMDFLLIPLMLVAGFFIIVGFFVSFGKLFPQRWETPLKIEGNEMVESSGVL